MTGKDASEAKAGIGNRLAPLRFVLFVAIMAGAFLACRWLWPAESWPDAIAMAFDIAAVPFLVSLAPLLLDSDPRSIRRHSRENDANRLIVLLATSLLTLVIMAAIFGEIERAREGDPAAIAKLIGTLALTWLFANSVYALHYAHLYYAAKPDGGDCQGLDFPGKATPDYSDFAYFSFTLGMTFQTSDVAITERRMRRVAILHSGAAFIFNIGVIAFTINALGGSG